MPPPQPFAVGTYAAWHEAQFPDDAPLVAKVEALRAHLKASSRKELALLERIVKYSAEYSQREYQTAKKVATAYQLSLVEALLPSEDEAYDSLFKSTESIINKIWRKNREKAEVHLGNVRERITDLVRTDISASTLDSVVFLAERMNILPAIIYDSKLRKDFDASIASVHFEAEMKMESGYFAYHGLVRSKSGLTVEVQIYSELARQWRMLSHTLYEQARIAERLKHEFNSKASRIISLGHLLHVAECQLAELAQEFAVPH